MKKLTLAQVNNYVESPHTCPYCGSDNISCDAIEPDSNIATQSIYCINCDRSWTDVYKLINIYEHL